MLKKIIIIEDNIEIQCDTQEEVVKALIDENYYNMSNEEKENKMKMKALANCVRNKMKIISNPTQEEIKYLEEEFIVKDEVSYILSLLKMNNVLLLENKEANIFTKGIKKEKIKENYILVNTFAKALLKKHLLEI